MRQKIVSYQVRAKRSDHVIMAFDIVEDARRWLGDRVDMSVRLVRKISFIAEHEIVL